MKEIALGVADTNSLAVAKELSILLADENVLLIKTKNALWNMEGDDFYGKHLLLEEQIHHLNEIINNVAERMRSIGYFARAAMKTYLNITHLSEATREANDNQGFIKELLADHESIIVFLRENIRAIQDDYNDAETIDFILEVIKKHEELSWPLRSHLKN
jgi:starvation-inducible DNA-binding protein